MQAAERTPALIGRYEIERLLGRGAMGRVLLAHDPVLDRGVAVKLLRDDLRIPPEQRAGLIDRMRQEARASARVTHPNIVELFDMGEDPELGLYLVFEYAEGLTLKERLLKAPLAAAAAATLSRQLGDALFTAHEKGVLHRDIKPENVILTATGAKIADFGIARVPDSTLTREGGLLGTPAYSAPESIAHGTFSPRTDQFSMAATLYEAISQRRAFPGEDAVSVASRIATDEAPPIALACGLSPEVDAVLARALAKNPAQRYETARAFGHALADALEELPRSTLLNAGNAGNAAQRADFSEARSMRLIVGAAVVGALVGVAAMQLTSRLRAAREPMPERSPVVAAPVASSAIGWLAPAPRPRARQSSAVPRAVTSIRPERRSPSPDTELDGDRAATAGRDGGAPAPGAELEP